MQMGQKGAYSATGVLLIALGWGSPAISQEAESPESAEFRMEIEEVTVLATKREESIQDVPISVTAFSAADLIEIGAMNMQDIASRTPSLKFGNRSDLKIGNTTIRGIGRLTGASAGTEEAVAYYVDEVYVGGGVGANLDLFDLDRVEVLRGPQGTLFGRNSVGGAINITTRKPTKETEGYLDVSYGNYDALRVQSAVGGTLVQDRIFGKISGVYYDRDGYTDNRFNGVAGDTANNEALRGQLRILPTGDASDMEFNISAEYRKVDQRSKFFDTLRFEPDFPPSYLALGLGLYGIPQDDDPYDREVDINEPGRETLDAWSIAVNGLINLGDMDLTTITAYRTHDYFNQGDTDGSPLDWAIDGDPEDVWRFSQELRLTSNYTGQFNWIAGIYYMRQNATNQSNLGLGADEEAILGIPVITFGSDAETDLDSLSAFFSLDYSFSEKMQVTLGGRYVYEDKSIEYVQSDPFELAGGSFVLNGQDSWNDFTPSLSARYFITEDVMGYAIVSRGFKSGGFNDGLGSGANISFDPETLWNYEIGLKSSWLDQRLVANFDVFYMDWNDIQFNQDNPDTVNVYDPITGNAAKAHSQGLEAELYALPTKYLRLGLAASLIEAEFDEGVLPTGPDEGIPLGELPGSPDYTLNLNAEYWIPVSSTGGDITLAAEYLRQGDIEYSTTGDAIAHVDSVGVWNARVHYSSPGEKWIVTLWGKNLADEIVVERVFELFSNPFIGRDFVVLAPPRTYGVSVRFNF